MQALARGEPPVPHGFKGSVGTSAGAALYERVLARDLTRRDLDALGATGPFRDATAPAVRRVPEHPQVAEHTARRVGPCIATRGHCAGA